MKKSVYVALLVFISCILTSCKNKEVDIEDTIIGREYGEWEKINSVVATTNNQQVQSITGQGVSHKFEISLSAEWEEIVVGTLKYELELDSAKYSGTSTYINKGYTIDFYCRIACDIHRIEKIESNNPEKKETIEVSIPRGPEYGWMIYDENNILVEDTVYGNAISVEVEEVVRDKVECYILDSKYREISIEELEELSDDELRFIRNGIYAYCGREFTDDLRKYYEQYEWYNPYISKEDFDWDYFNVFQQRTIENIVGVERHRD